MNRIVASPRTLPLLLVLLACGLMLASGTIRQPPDYDRFADQSSFLGIPHSGDVLSNLGFALVGLWGLLRLHPRRAYPALARGWPGYRLFLVSMILIALGSAYYHWAPDDTRIVWDRLPIAMVCAGLLSAVWAETQPGARDHTTVLALLAVASVAWSAYTGDLRPYILAQGLPLLLAPLLQTIYHAPGRDRAAVGFALLLYGLAKLAELHDQHILALLGGMSGHTLKHLLAVAAGAVLVGRLAERVETEDAAHHPDRPR